MWDEESCVLDNFGHHHHHHYRGCCRSWRWHYNEEQEQGKLGVCITACCQHKLSWHHHPPHDFNILIPCYSSYTPYALDVGAWNINNAPIGRYDGICRQDYTTAVAGCGPLSFPFTISKAGSSYQIINSPYTDMNGVLTPPVNDEDMYSLSSYSSGQAPYVVAPCIAIANVTIKVGKAHQYQFSK